MSFGSLNVNYKDLMRSYLQLKQLFTSLQVQKKCITTALGVVVLFFMVACTDVHPDTVSISVDRTKLPRMIATHVTTLISDSGITRYRITTPIWYVYDRAMEPYWNFPKGIFLQRFNESYHVDGSIRCDSARYFEAKQLWELDGKVKAMNLQGETFESSQLFWDQHGQRIYSDSLIRVTQHVKIIIGVGFDSNQALTKYTIREPEGIIPVNPTTTPK
jgi:LPS export ABC transporter protein LptC